METYYLTGILIVSMVLYINQRLSMITISVLLIVSLVLTGILELDQALSGFSNPATITIGAMFVLSMGLIKTGALEPLTLRLAEWSGGKPARMLLVLALTVPLASAFINNTPVVIMMVPVILTLCRKFSIAPSKLFIPLSYFAIIGGTCTLVGTSTNLLVDEVYSHQTGLHLGIFEFAPMGLLMLVAGSLFIIIFGNKLLPHHESLSSLLDLQQHTHYAIEVIVQPSSPLVNKIIGDVFDKSNPLRLLELLREEVLYSGSRVKNLAIKEHDALILEGSPRELTDFIDANYAELPTVLEDERRVPMRTISLQLVELMVLPESTYIGKQVRELGLNSQYGVKVMALQRKGRRHLYELRGMRIQAGDLLLVQSDKKGVEALKKTGEVLVMTGHGDNGAPRPKAWRALGIMVGVIITAMVTNIPLVVLSMIGAVLMVRTGCLRMEEAVDSLDFNVLFLLAGTIPLGLAFEESGLAISIVNWMLGVMDSQSPMLMISVLYLFTNLLSALLSNSAVAVLMTPIALSMAQGLNLDPKPFVMAVAFGASAAFATPIGYQTNIIVMGPGGYRFRDFFNIGIPLTILFWILASVMIPILWPPN